jgi:hypothetical protein
MQKIFLNTDETWINQTDFRHHKYGFPGTTNSVSKNAVSPRITMILGIDTLCNTFVSFSHSNSNSELMEIFYRQLSIKLEKQMPNWRSRYVILVDGASYH